MDGIQLSDYLQTKGYSIKSKTNTSIVILVAGDRIKKMLELAEMLKGMGAVVDKNIKGSSIGGIVIGKVKILIKAAGRTGGLDVEMAAIADLEDAIMQAIMLTGGAIDVKLKDRVIKGVVGVEKTAGTPKSDFHLIDINNKALCHISHKKGSTPRDFQQWGGVTEMDIINHPEVEEFAKDCKILYGDKIPSGESVYKIIKDIHLARMSVFGVGYNRGVTNASRVDVLIQGDPGLKRLSNGAFELTATGHIHYLADLPTGNFAPVLACIYKGDRDQLGIKGARFSIYPLGGRTFKRQIK